MTKFYEMPCGCKVKQLGDNIKPEDGLPPLNIDYLEINHNCPLIWQIFSDGYTKGIFQLETSLGHHWSKKVKPENLEEVSALIAAIRPGSLKAREEDKSMTEHYVDRKHGVDEPKYFHSDAEKILRESYGIILFQEQTLAIAKHFAGFNLVQADNLRRAMGKKDAELMNKCKAEFTEGCKKTGILNEEVSKQVFDIIEKSNRYSFNKCVSGDTRLRQKNGCTLTVKELYESGQRPSALSMDADGKISQNNIVDVKYNGRDTLYRVTTAGGETIKVTWSHKFPTPFGEKPLSELRVGDSIYVLQVSPRMFTVNDTLKLDGNHRCNNCGTTTDKILTCNRDGNRFNQKISNLVNLCKVCYKIQKAKSKLNKEKYGTYFARPEKIISIESIVGYHETFDIEMKAPNHNFVVEDGIVTSNSHSIAYGEVGIWTAFVKSHFPVHFFTAALSMADEKLKPREEIKELVQEARAMGIEVVGPSIFEKNEDFSIRGLKVTFGLSKIKAVGVSKIEKLFVEINELEKLLNKNIKDFSWLEMLYYLLPKLGKSLSISLISSGALSKYGMSRKRMLFEVDKLYLLKDREIEWIVNNAVNEQPQKAIEKLLTATTTNKKGQQTPFITEKRKPALKSVYSLLSNPPETLTDSVEYISALEEELLGTALTCSKLDSCDSSTANLTCKDFAYGTGSKNIILAVQIDSCREWQPPDKESTLAFCRIHDDSGVGIDMMIPSDTYDQFGYLIFKGNTILVQGMRNKKGGLTAQKISQI